MTPRDSTTVASQPRDDADVLLPINQTNWLNKPRRNTGKFAESQRKIKKNHLAMYKTSSESYFGV